MTDEKVRENRLRRMADRQGLRLVKSRSRDEMAMDYGLYGLIDIQTNGTVFPPLAGRWICTETLDEIEKYLSRPAEVE
ncbi:hypothetical protein BTR14_03245 [Rhizobium rhizosphaerae]|uniref:Uncharacterized protein n=1 Tax=Xaviernesmea rhizosphaerae TaxID=1672749 RepID=A0ABX3PGT4_9HYPH|nr:hypothetical protein [Xaviernesmea rhizosphaerae]OQP87597.1 hypothetical protein BTR14_03245 [Xaviernesmea rhizosphaerae]